MSRFGYQIRTFGNRPYPFEQLATYWADTLTEAKKTADSHIAYKRCDAGKNYHCACDRCLEHLGIHHVEILQWSRDAVHGLVDIETGKGWYRRKESNGLPAHDGIWTGWFAD